MKKLITRATPGRSLVGNKDYRRMSFRKAFWILRGRQKKSGLTYLNQQNSVNILTVGAYYTPNQQKFYKDHTELYKFDIGAVIQLENK